MPADNPPTTRRRLLKSVTTVGLAGLVSGAGTWSYFSDSEEAVATITAGTMDLEVAGGDTTQQFTIADADPGDSGTETIRLWNNGSISGELSVRLHLLECENEDQDNVENRPCEWDPDPGNSENENSGKSNDKNGLAENLQVEIGFDRDETVGGDDTTTVVSKQYVSNLSFPSDHPSPHQLLGKGKQKDSTHLFLNWEIDDTKKIKGDTLGFGITVTLG